MMMRVPLVRVAIVLLAALGLAACDSTSPAEHLQRALEQESRGRISAAVIEIKNALRKDADFAAARFHLGRIELRLGQFADAQADLERAASAGFDDPELLPLLTRARLALADTESVVPVIEDLEQLPPDRATPELRALLGRAYLIAGQVDQGRSTLQKVLAEDPRVAEAHIALAELDLGQGDLKGALEHARAATKASPDRDSAWLILGRVQLAERDYSAAIEAFDQAMQLGGAAAPSAELGRTQALLAAGRTEEALKASDGLVSKYPGFLQARFLRAAINVASGDTDSALEDLDLILAAVPEDSRSRHLRGVLLFQQGDAARALEDLEKVLSSEPTNVQARLLVAALYRQQGRYSDALEALQTGLEFARETPMLPDYLSMLGDVRLRLGEFEEGIAALQQAAEVAPGAPKPQIQLAMAQVALGAPLEVTPKLDLTTMGSVSRVIRVMALLRTGRLDEASLEADKLTEDEPDSPYAHALRGSVRLAMGDTTAATASFERALELDEHFLTALINLAMIRSEGGDLAGARALYAQALQIDPNNRRALERMLQLDAKSGTIEQSIERLTQAIDRNPEDPRLRALLARAHLAAGSAERAYRAIQDVAINPDTPRAVLDTAIKASLASRHLDLAAAALEEVLRRNPDDPKTAARLATVLMAARRFDAAAQLLPATSEISEAPEPLAAATVRLYLSEGRIDAAREALTALRASKPTSQTLPILEADLAVAEGRLEDALPHYMQAYARRPSAVLALKLSDIRLRMGDADKAAEVMRDWLDAHPDDIPTRKVFAGQLLRTGHYRQALEHFEVIAQAQTKAVDVLNNMAWAHAQLGNPQLAVRYAREALELAPNSLPVIDTLGWVLVAEGEFDEALPLLERACTSAPDNPEFCYHYAVALDGVGKKTAAIRELERALKSERFASRPAAVELLTSLRSG